MKLFLLITFYFTTLFAADCELGGSASCASVKGHIESFAENGKALSKESRYEDYPSIDFDKICNEAKNRAKELKKNNINMRIGLQIDFGTKGSYSGRILKTDDQKLVALMTRKYFECFNQSDKTRCTGIKHFPNLVHVGAYDPHVTVDKREVVDLAVELDKSLAPFHEASDSGACSLMTSHIPVKTSDGKNTICTLNKECINFIRNNVGYHDLIITDELLVMNPVLYEMWNNRYRPKDLRLQKEWDQILWSTDLEAMNNALSQNDWKVYDKWIKKDRQDKKEKITDIILNERCGSNAKCIDKNRETLNEELTDKLGSKRALEALKAGNDMVLLFPLPELQEPTLNAVIAEVEDAVTSGKLSLKQLDESVLRVLKRKEKSFPRFFKFNNKTPEEYLKRINLKTKIAQLFVFSGEFKDETSKLYLRDIGGIYYFNYGIDENQREPKFQSHEFPPLRMGDLPDQFKLDAP